MIIYYNILCEEKHLASVHILYLPQKSKLLSLDVAMKECPLVTAEQVINVVASATGLNDRKQRILDG